MIYFLMAGLGGLEPPKCQSQSLVPYHLATAQYKMKLCGVISKSDLYVVKIVG